MSKTDIDVNGALAEYNSLRQEVVAISNKRTQRLAITMAALPTLISVGFVSNLPEITALTLIVVSSGWNDDHRVRQSTHRIGAYIKYFLEPVISGVNWETVLATSVRKPSTPTTKLGKLKKWFTSLKSTIFYTYGVITLIAFIATLGSSIIVFLTPYSKELEPIGSLMQISQSDPIVLITRVVIFSLISALGLIDVKKAICEGMKTQEKLHEIHNSMREKSQKGLVS